MAGIPYPGWWWWQAYPGGPGGPAGRNPRTTNMENAGLGAPGYDISGMDPMSYYNNPGPTLGAQSQSMMGAGSPYLDKGAANYYGYGNIFGFPGMNQGASQTGNIGNLSALGTGGASTQPLAALAPNQQTATGNLNLGQRQPTWSPPISSMFGPPGPPTTQGNVTYSTVGPMEQLLDRLFKGSVTGKGGGPIANQLFNMGLGMLPPALAEQIVGTTNEQFGKLGARFGTDLATAQARGLAQASEAQSLNAIREILGLGGTTAGFQFQRGESALQRAMQEFIAQQQMDPLSGILQGLLGGG